MAEAKANEKPSIASADPETDFREACKRLIAKERELRGYWAERKEKYYAECMSSDPNFLCTTYPDPPWKDGDPEEDRIKTELRELNMEATRLRQDKEAE
ncbi:MAG: hypothetical protein GY832_22275 [Chloroflexi bacterium]|nr:hypothetical protein [Chloroflexota bacterium]